MSDPNARKDVNNAIINQKSGTIGQLVDTANSSKKKREENKREREAREEKQRQSDSKKK